MKRLSGLLTILLLGTGLLYAHHGWTGYDETKLVEYTGVIKEVGYENPHGFVKIEVDKKATWNVVLAPPTRMADRGLTKDKLKIGATATIAGYQHKQTKDEIRAERITIEGKTTELR
jgi:hypothetical protein